VSKATRRNLAIFLCLLFSGALSSITFAQGRPPQGRPAPGSQAPSLPSPVSETRMGMWRGRPVTYQVINGRNIYQGDMILENLQPMPQAGGVHPASVGLANSNFTWDTVNGVAQIPYVIEPTSGDQPNIQAAISIYNATFAGVIQFVPRASQANYVDIDLFDGPNGSCEAEEGDAHNGKQFVNGATNCTIATILHEFGHVTGVWHEQSRTDASTYVTLNEANVIKGSIGNFLPAVDNDQQNFGFYDYASVMEYPAFSFSRNGAPPLESIPPGMPLSNPVGYSAADVEGIMRLYGVAPTEVTVTSNPLGLQVLVDSMPITTPMTFSWNLNSMHTLAVATGVQTVNGVIVGSSNPQEPTTFYYEYGRWNDGQPQSHSITVTPGNGDAGFPVSAPQVATYTANFVQLVPYTSSVFPSGSGSVVLTGTPAPQNITVNGTPGTYVVARQQATLTATANSGFSFYEFNNGPYWLAGGLGSNPKTFYVPETGLTVNPSVEFTNTPVYTIDVTPNYFSSNLGVLVDAGFWDVPKNFSSFYDGSGWNSGGMHTLQFSSPQGPFSVNTQFAFSSWTPGGTANPLSITLPAASQSYIATISPEFVPATNFNFPPCGGTAAITPASTITGGFYPTGTQLTYTETPSPNTGGSPWTFTGWTFDLTGTTNPDMLTPTDESLVYANFNTASAPLTITSLSPASVASGGSAFTLTINGTGFTQNGTGNPIENVGINFPSIFLTPIFVSSTELQVTVPAADIATPGTFLVFVENFPSAPWTGCAIFSDQPFFVHQGTPSGATTVTATPTTLSFASTVVDQTSAGQTITVKNTGTTPTTIAITASTNFGQTNSCPATLAGGATCTITATFAPVTSGALTGNIAVTDSASNSPQTVTLSGTATPAPTTVTTNPTSLAFGSQNVGTTSAGQTFTVQNTGSASTSIAIAASANYAQINNCGNLLQIGTSCTVTVSFAPTANGSLPGNISITDSAANSPQVVTLSGTGTGTVTVTVTPSSETFPAQTVGTTSAAKVVTVKNTGTLSTTLTIGAATGDFAQTSTCGSTLNAGATCTVSVKFTPATTGSIPGVITVSDTASNSPQIVALTGTGAAPVTFSPVSLAFGMEAVNSTSTAKTVKMKNNMSGPLNGISIVASGNYSTTGGGTPCGTTLPGGASCTISVSFTPTANGSIDGAVTVAYTGVYTPQEVKLTGTGTGGPTSPLKFTPASLAFTSQGVGSTSGGKTVTVQNTSASTVTFSSIATSGNFTETGSGTTQCTNASVLAPSGKCMLSVTFTPSIAGAIQGALVISDNNVMVGQQVVNLTGTAVLPITIAPASLTFASQAVGSTSSPQILTLTNNSDPMLTSLSFAGSVDFSVTAGGTTPCGTSLAVGAKCTLSVTFTPSRTGSIQGAATITGSNNILLVAKLTGTGS
jgi:astacin (peptidase family M12A)/centrosomal CEP192-like protein